jgi:hypothetical protein
MNLPSPSVLDQLIRDRQEHLRQTTQQAQALGHAALRVRIGHALIVAGSTISGERVEVPARPSMSPRTA